MVQIQVVLQDNGLSNQDQTDYLLTQLTQLQLLPLLLMEVLLLQDGLQQVVLAVMELMM